MQTKQIINLYNLIQVKLLTFFQRLYYLILNINQTKRTQTNHNIEMSINGSSNKVQYRQVSSQYVPQYIEPSHVKHNFVHQIITMKNQNNQIVEYAPKLIKAGYILGDPVAFIQENKLPEIYSNFSPNKSHVINDPIIINNQTGRKWHMKHQGAVDINQQQSDYRFRSVSANQSRNIESFNSSNTKNQVSHVETVSKAQFDKLSQQYRNLSNSYTQLLLNSTQNNQNKQPFSDYALTEQNRQLKQKINYLEGSLRQRQRQSRSNTLKINTQVSPQMQTALGQLMQKYRQSILQEQALLLDRFRLQCKQDQLNQRQSKMHQKYSNKKNSLQSSRNRTSSHYNYK